MEKLSQDRTDITVQIPDVAADNADVQTRSTLSGEASTIGSGSLALGGWGPAEADPTPTQPNPGNPNKPGKEGTPTRPPARPPAASSQSATTKIDKIISSIKFESPRLNIPSYI